MSNAATVEKPATAKLIMPREEAVTHLRTALEKGTELKALRIRNGDDLDVARGTKLEWTQDCTDLLAQMFDNTSVADYFNDWVGKIFPEYAAFGNFVEQYYEEMDHRLAKLQTIVKRIDQATESQPLGSITTALEPSVCTSKSRSESNMPASATHKVLFVSHGPKDPSSEAVLQFVQQLNLGVMEADHTNGLIETLEGRADMGFIIVMNAVANADHAAALSENSMFKLGYCAGKLGLKRMCMMHGPAHAPLGESHGIAHVPVDVNGGWQLHLARQLRRAGIDVDLNRLA